MNHKLENREEFAKILASHLEVQERTLLSTHSKIRYEVDGVRGEDKRPNESQDNKVKSSSKKHSWLQSPHRVAKLQYRTVDSNL